MHRFFIEQKFENNKINPSKKIIHQLVKVLRIKKNEDFIVIQAQKEYLCNLVDNQIILKKELIRKVKDNDFKSELILVQGIPRNKKLSVILQKATEIGVDHIYLWKTIHSNALLQNISKKDHHFKEIVREASEQANRIDIPQIWYVNSFNEIKFLEDDLLLVFYEKADPIKDHIKNYLNNFNNFKRIFVFIGPEGGWSEEEIGLFKLKEALLLSMGENILRTETAAIVALGLIKYLN